MNLISAIRLKLKKTDESILAKNLGYNSKAKYQKTIDKFLSQKELYKWLSLGHYDFVHTSSSFLKKLCAELFTEPRIYEKEIKLAIDKSETLRKSGSCYIYVNTNFRRTTEPIFALAFMESKRNICIDKEELIFKEKKEILEIVSNVIKNHYNESKGILPLWGKIENYVYHHGDEASYVFDINGKVIKSNQTISESKATLLIGNSPLFL